VSRLRTLGDLAAWRADLTENARDDAPCIVVCNGPGCSAAGSRAVAEAIDQAVTERDGIHHIAVRQTGCLGLCECGPVVLTLPDEVFYQKVAPSDAADIVAAAADGTGPVERLLYTDVASGERIEHLADIPFYAHQRRRLLERLAHIRPTEIADYVAAGGYGSLAKVLGEMTPEAVIDEITRSQLRGRGGAGFPTGMKWGFCRSAEGDGKHIICNADEGDPGAYMDRAMMEGNPHAVIEGMLIGAYAMGASQGTIYCRAEYPDACAIAHTALAQAREHGLLGTDILGSGLDFDLRVMTGAGAFVCGEETALIASLEDKPGEPRPRPPFPAQAGLWGKPTNINNVETWANVSLVIERGAEWFASVGTERSKGTKIFSLVGEVRNTGLVEVPMGTTLNRLVFDIGGGPLPGRTIKGIQTGGPSGGCIPVRLFDLPADYESLGQAGSIMGSGGLIVMDDHTCIVDVARYFLTFLKDESCGKCAPCREGIPRMLDIVTRICEGQGREEDLDVLEQLGRTVKATSLCGLGQTAANPLLSTLRYFRDEYEAHIRDHRCPAGVCRALIRFEIDPEACTGCGACSRECPSGAITGERKQPHRIDPDTCVKCGLCLDVCPSGAVTKA